MLPGHLIAEFWLGIEEELEKDHHFSRRDARRGIEEFRQWLDSHQVGEMIYHMNSSDVLAIVAGGIRQGGFFDPEPLNGQEKAFR